MRCRDIGHQSAQRLARERHRDQKNDEDGNDLGNKDQRLFLDLGQGLEQADAQAHHQRRQHGGSDDLEQGENSGAGKVDRVNGVHFNILIRSACS